MGNIVKSRKVKVREPRRLTPELLGDLLRIHATCVHDQEHKCALTVFLQPLCWEINLALGLGNDEDRAFRRVNPLCAARPLRTPFVEEGCRQADSMNEEE